MTIAKIPMLAVLLPCLVACAGGSHASSAPPVAPPAAASPTTAPDAPRGAALDSERLLGSADAIRRDQLGIVARDDRFESARQVVELRKAVALYRQFIDRAAGDPRYLEAVRRTEGRIEDAEKTIEFLLAGAGAE